MTTNDVIHELEKKRKLSQERAEKLKHNAAALHRNEAAASAYSEAIELVRQIKP